MHLDQTRSDWAPALVLAVLMSTLALVVASCGSGGGGGGTGRHRGSNAPRSYDVPHPSMRECSEGVTSLTRAATWATARRTAVLLRPMTDAGLSRRTANALRSPQPLSSPPATEGR